MQINRQDEMKNTTKKSNTTETKTENNVTKNNEKASPIGESPNSGEVKIKLQQCEDIIRQNENGAFITGRNLALINKEALYIAAGFTSFEAYCKDRWGMSDKHAYRLIKAAECYDVLSKHQTTKNWVLPRNESQIRPLAKLGEKDWVPKWEKVMKKFAGKSFTAEDIGEFLIKATQPAANDSAAPVDDDGAADETAKEIPADKLKKKLEKIDKLVREALESATTDGNIPAKDYRKLLEKIKELIEGSK